MSELKDKSIHLTAEKLAEEIKVMKVYKNFYTDLQVRVCCTIFFVLLY